MLGHASFETLANSTDILTDMGPGSPARGMKWIDGSGELTIVTCPTGYASLANTDIPAETDAGLNEEGRKAFPG